jgi:hypothetical protein
MPDNKPFPSEPLNLEVLNTLLMEELSSAAGCTVIETGKKCAFCQWVDEVAKSNVLLMFNGYIAYNLHIPTMPPLSLFAVSCQMLRIGMKYAAAVKEVSFLEEMEKMK